MMNPLTDDLIARLNEAAEILRDSCAFATKGGPIENVGALMRAAAEALAAASRPPQERLYTNDEMLKIRADAHGDGQIHAIADVNAGLIDDLIAPRLAAASRQLNEPVDAEQLREYLRFEGIRAMQEMERADAAEAALADLRASPVPAATPPWQPISTAPKDGTLILTACGEDRRLTMWVEYPPTTLIPNGISQWSTGYGPGALRTLDYHPTHWAALPSPPASAPQPTTTNDDDHTRVDNQ